MIACPVEFRPSPEKPETIRFLGVQWGTSMTHPIYLSQKNAVTGEWLLVVKVRSHTYWAGIGMSRGFTPTEFNVFRITSTQKRGKPREWTATSLIQIPLRKREAEG